MESIQSLSFTEKKILNLIQKKGNITKSEILEITEMKLTSLNRVMKKLLSKNLILKVGIAESTGGRKPSLYDVNANYGYIIGINISRIYSSVVIVNMKMDIVSIEKFTMTEDHTPEVTVRAISEIINTNLEKLKISMDKVLGVGVGTVGPLDRKSGMMLNVNAFPSIGWENVNIRNLLETQVKFPILLDNGANTAVIGEALYGYGKGYKNIAYFNCGIGIRTGITNGSTLIRTINDTEDAFGHMIIDINGEPCSCGNKGCIESYSSIPSIVNRFKRKAKAENTTTILKPLVDIKYFDICDAAIRGDELSKRLIENAGEILGTGLSNFSNLLNPDLIILSGPLVNYCNIFYDIVEKTFRSKTYFKKEKKVIFNKGGQFKDNSIALGAAAMFLEQMLE
ncbi:ROK family transcriptional regulator [Wukongibacter baidiensis]|uniref:ROK family transcriptional regulator n=1 Tax=Wukongibacter baidiensis TaxID=1723361 RepID=UPI003D7F5621